MRPPHDSGPGVTSSRAARKISRRQAPASAPNDSAIGIRAGIVCDFCEDEVKATDPNVVEFEHEAFTFTSHAELGTVTILHPAGGWWLACTFCKPLVRNREWRKLLDRYCDHFRRAGRPIEPSMRGEATALQRKLGQHLTGREREPRAAAGAA